MQRPLSGLGTAIAGLADAMGEVWASTGVLAGSEFGRTVKANGTGGCDHGVGGVALLAGGALAGGRVVADWPGLAPDQLHEGRDLRATTDLRSVFKGILRDHLQVPAGALDQRVFPDSAGVLALEGLVRT